MTSFSWTAESTAALQEQTREQQFDFEKVAIEVRTLYKHLNCEVTPSDCRIAYANHYLSNTKESEFEATDLDIDDSMTFEEIMDVVEVRNERSERRNQKVFERVLASLGSVSDTLPLEESAELEKIKSTVLERKVQREMEQERIKVKALEDEENKWIANEREKLRQRHLPECADSDGEYASSHLSAPFELDGEQDSEEEPEPGLESLLESSRTQGHGQNTRMTELFANENLDSILEEIERELDARAGSKDDTLSDNSELSQVLAFLDDAADKRKTATASAVTPAPTAHTAQVLLPPTVPTVSCSFSDAHMSAPHTKDEDDDKAEDTEGVPLPPLNDSAVAVSDSNVPIAPVHPDTTDSCESAGSGHQGIRVQDPRGGMGGRGQYGSRSRPRSDPPRGSREEVDKSSGAEREDSDSDSVEDGGGSDSDGDDDWADTRSNMKSKASRYTCSSFSSSLPSSMNTPRVESAHVAASAVNERSLSSASNVSEGDFSDITVPTSGSKLEVSRPCDLISDTSAPMQTASVSALDSIILVSTVSVPPLNVLPLEHVYIPLSDVACKEQDAQHQLSGSLLTGRSGAASRKKPAPRPLQPRAPAVDSSI